MLTSHSCVLIHESSDELIDDACHDGCISLGHVIPGIMLVGEWVF